MTDDIVDSLRLVRESIAREAGHVSEWSPHDLACADAAYDAENEIESLRRENERLEAELNHKVSVAEDATTALVDLAVDGEFTRLRRERDRLREALMAFSMNGPDDCWCGVAINDPRFQGVHTQACQTAKRAMKGETE